MEPMEVGQLIADVRISLDDTTARPRWSQDFLRAACAEAQREACFRARLIFDDTTEEVCRVPLVAGLSEYVLDPRIIELRDDIRLLNDRGPLRRATLDDLEEISPRWREHEARVPRRYMIDRMGANYLRLTLYATPIEQDEMDTLVLPVYRLPLEDPEQDGDELEIDPHYQGHLRHWVIYRAYLDRDPDRYDPLRAADHLAQFEAIFGRRESAHVERMRTPTRRQRTVPRRVC